MPDDPATEVTEPAPEPRDTTPGDEQTFTHEYVKDLRSEARRHRTALREAEADRDRLRDRVDVYDRAEVARIAGLRLHDPSDLLDRTPLAELRDEDGLLDTDTVRARVDQLASERPHLVRPPQSFDGGVRGPATPPPARSFGSVLKDR